MPRQDAITLKQLRALRAVSELGTITSAAGELGLTPPAVHTQLRGLETSTGCKLLKSSGSAGAVLTAEGKVVLEAEHQITATLDSCMLKVQALRDGQTGVVVLGVVSTGKYFAPRLVALLKATFPKIDVILRVGNRQDIVSELNDRSIELAIMGRPPRSPAVVSEMLGVHPHVIIASPEHPLANVAHVAVDDLLAQTFITREQGSGTRILMTRYLDRIGEGMTYRQIEMGSNETIKQAVIANLGIAMISQHTATEEIKSGRLVTLNSAGLPIDRQWYLLHRQDLTVTNTIATVRDFILELEANYLPVL